MPKCPRSSGPPRSVFGTCINSSSRAQNAPRRGRGHGEKATLEGASGGEESADLVGVLHSGRIFDAGGNVDRRGAGNSHSLRQQLGGNPASQQPRPPPVPPGNQSPIECQTIAARQRICTARRFCIKQQQVSR